MTQPTDDAEPSTEPTTSATTGGSVRDVQYKGAELDAERGPGLGCFRFQLVVLVVLLVLTPIGVNAGWPDWLTAALLFVTLALLLVAGQTVIFLLRLVAADRRGRRRPLASQTRTVGELDDEARAAEPEAAQPEAAEPEAAEPEAAQPETAFDADPTADPSADGRDGDRSVRQ